MKYVLKNGRVISGRKNAEVTDCNVYVQNGRITRIANDDDFDGWDVVDLNHAYVLPGLINMHAHLFGTGRPSKTLGGGGMKDQILAAASTALGKKVLDSVVYSNVLNALNAGTTTLRGVGDFYYSDVRTRDAIKNGRLGPRLLVSGPAITCPTGHGDGTFAVVGSTPDYFRRLAQTNIDHHVDLIKICVTGGVMDAKKKGEPGVTKMTPEQTKAVCDYAHEKGYIVASHTESTKGIQVALDGGVDTIEHGAELTPELIQEFKDHHAALTCTLSPALPLAKLPPEKTRLNEMCTYNANYLFQEMVRGVRQALEAGIPVGLGTDASCPYVTQYNMYRELIYLNKLCGVSPADCIYHATLGNAEIMKIDNLTGSVEEGKSADLMVVKNNPLDNLGNLKQPCMVIMQGRIINDPKVKRNEAIDKELDLITASL